MLPTHACLPCPSPCPCLGVVAQSWAGPWPFHRPCPCPGLLVIETRNTEVNSSKQLVDNLTSMRLVETRRLKSLFSSCYMYVWLVVRRVGASNADTSVSSF